MVLMQWQNLWILVGKSQKENAFYSKMQITNNQSRITPICFIVWGRETQKEQSDPSSASLSFSSHSFLEVLPIKLLPLKAVSKYATSGDRTDKNEELGIVKSQALTVLGLFGFILFCNSSGFLVFFLRALSEGTIPFFTFLWGVFSSGNLFWEDFACFS